MLPKRGKEISVLLMVPKIAMNANVRVIFLSQEVKFASASLFHVTGGQRLFKVLRLGMWTLA